MKNYFIILFILTFIVCCKKTIKIDKETPITKTVVFDSTVTKNLKAKKKIQTKIDFKSVLKLLKDVKHTGTKYSDELTNSSSNFISYIFNLNEKELLVKTTSYTYKNKCIFYVHNIKCTNDSLSIKPFLENAQGNRTKGYLGARVLIFAMKNDKEANYIDLPEKRSPFKLRTELLEILYKNIDSDVIECNRTKNCKYKDLRKTKSE